MHLRICTVCTNAFCERHLVMIWSRWGACTFPWHARRCPPDVDRGPSRWTGKVLVLIRISSWLTIWLVHNIPWLVGTKGGVCEGVHGYRCMVQVQLACIQGRDSCTQVARRTHKVTSGDTGSVLSGICRWRAIIWSIVGLFEGSSG